MIFFKFPVESSITSTQTMNVKTEFDTNCRTIHQAFFSITSDIGHNLLNKFKIDISKNHIKRARRLYKKSK